MESIPVALLAQSQILVPVTIRREALATMANQSLPPVLAGGGTGAVNTVVGNLDYSYDYRFVRSPFSVNVNSISFSLATRLSGTVTVRSHGVSATAQTSLAVMISGNVSVSPGWNLAPELWGRLVVESADIPLGFDVLGTRVGFSISVKDDLERAMQAPFDSLLTSLRKAASSYDLRPQVLPLWNALRSPVSVSVNPPIWLTMVPDGAFFAPRDSSDGDLHVMVGLRAQTSIVFGERPDDREVGDLPLLERPQGPSGFRLRVPIRIPFAELSRLASEAVVGKRFEMEGGDITLSSLAVFGSGSQVSVRTGFSARHPALGSFQGTLYFAGRPRFDEAGQRVVIEDFDFDAQTSQALTASAGWLLHDQLVTRGSSAVNRAFAELGDAPVKTMLERINAELARISFRGMVIEGTLSEIKILSLGNDFKNLIIEAEFSGDLKLSVNLL